MYRTKRHFIERAARKALLVLLVAWLLVIMFALGVTAAHFIAEWL